jgi:hypothetical protein
MSVAEDWKTFLKACSPVGTNKSFNPLDPKNGDLGWDMASKVHFFESFIGGTFFPAVLAMHGAALPTLTQLFTDLESIFDGLDVVTCEGVLGSCSSDVAACCAYFTTLRTCSLDVSHLVSRSASQHVGFGVRNVPFTCSCFRSRGPPPQACLQMFKSSFEVNIREPFSFGVK